ncbi:MAG: sulfurtransferase TusA family protein [Promethearchaeota archaeon]
MDLEFDEKIDLCGEICPVPAVKTKKKLGKMRNGSVLKLITDYKPATESVCRVMEKTSHKFLGMEEDEDEGTWELYFKCNK